MSEKKREDDPQAVVEDINSDLWDVIEKLDLPMEVDGSRRHPGDVHAEMGLVYMSTGNYECIMLGDHHVCVWDSEDRRIPWDDDKDAPAMSLHEFVMRQVLSRASLHHLVMTAVRKAQSATAEKN